MTSITPGNERAWAAVRLSARWDLARRRITAGQQLKVADGRLLWLFRDGRSRTLREVADELGLEQSTVNRQVHAAAKSGLLERSREPDQHADVWTATSSGSAQLEEDFAANLDRYKAALQAVPVGERDQFLERLDQFLDALIADTDPDVDR